MAYNDGNIIQVLEGEQSVVDATYGRISNDPRHSGICQLIRKQISTPEFHRWSLGVHNSGVLRTYAKLHRNFVL